jgi:Polyketide cyclase / dehydrase and lipid transport
VQADANAPVFATGEIEMAADPETVWAVMADIGRWPDWNPDITEATVHGPVQTGTTFDWKSGPGTIRSTFQVVERPTELSWTGKTMGIPAIHVYRLRPSDQHPGHTVVRLEESWDGLLARRLRRPFTRTLQTAIDSGLARLRPRPSGKPGATLAPGRSRHQARASASAGAISAPGSGPRSLPQVCSNCCWPPRPCWTCGAGPPTRSGAESRCGRRQRS